MKSLNGSTLYTIEGNTSSGNTGSQDNGGCVAAKTRSANKVFAYIRGVDFEALQKAVKERNDALTSTGADVESLWKYFKTMGYPDPVIAGILGCWQAESGINAKRVEWDTSNAFKSTIGTYDNAATDRSAMDKFTLKLFDQYAAQGKSIKRSAYYESGTEGVGHMYPGLGLAQWTGGRGKALIDFAKSKNMPWYNHAVQLAYMDHEMKNDPYYKNGYSHISQATTPEEGARLFCKWYEGYTGDLGERPKAAKKFYDTYAGKVNATTGMGGPIISDTNFDMTPKEQLEMYEEMKSMDSHDAKFSDENAVGGPEDETMMPAIPGDNGVKSVVRMPSKPVEASANRQKARQMTSFRVPTAAISTPSAPAASELPIGGPVETPAGSSNTVEIIALLKSALAQLENISENTGSSSNLLSSLNDKDFSGAAADQGAGITTKRTKTTKGTYRGSSTGNNTRMIANLARP